MAGEEYVTLVVGGRVWTARERITVGYSSKDAARSFAFTATDASLSWGDMWEFKPGEKVSVYVGGGLLLTGYIDKMSPSYDATNHKVEVSGRSKSKDSIDSSHDHKTGEFRDKTLLEIAKELDEQDVGFATDQQLQKMPLFRVHPGETVFSAVERAARSQGMLLQGQPDGSILITKGSGKRVHPPLIEGINILSASANFDESGKNSKITVKGQRAFGGPDAKSMQITATATNTKVKSNRPKTILAEHDMSQDDAKKRAKWHKERQDAESITASVTCQGWRDSNGSVWQVNTLVHILSPMLKLDMDMLLDSVSLSQDESGSKAALSFTSPKSLGGSSGGSGSGPYDVSADDE